ncbi:benzoate 4-monooxygenase cytochrome P450 [Fusarium tjaetaba]|uniref:Benzoate 4-monooxygenase cytochrome P450 n=1 Tax=Fusarium tjaetaba TaxID=1567544 RepID=A0A8H5QW81_9HYPO|nr:benzoate 4-monooxygenase cytochrome P450 [Fusarium tjaetaba]KAF5622230.1 benzoate 4-monooxygenase cytochrome P450 [Fusarium tjaetaba]
MTYLSSTSPVTVAIVASTVLVLSLFVTLFRRYWTLRHIPGPFLASCTDLWAAIRVWRGKYYQDMLEEWHAKYGPVVRAGPNRVSFADPDAIPEIYGTSLIYPKSDSYRPMEALAKGDTVHSIITVRDEKRVTGIKRHVGGGFSQTQWLKQEDQMDGTISALLTQLHKRPAGIVIPLREWLGFWSFDTLTSLAFSKTRGYLQAGADVDSIFPSAAGRFRHWRTWALAPQLESLLLKNWFMQRAQTTSTPIAQLAMERIRDRSAEEKNETGRDLLGRYLAASQAAPDVIRPKDVIALTITTIHAGPETTAIISAMALSMVLGSKNSEFFRKLEKEILDAELPVGENGAIAFKDVEHLPYLDAVIRETLRWSINPNVNSRTINTPGGVTICDTFIPEGTDVMVSSHDIRNSTRMFGPDASVYNPERWVRADEQKHRDMERSAMGFSWGRRVCMGQHLARIEMKKLIASLINAFEIEPVKVGETGKWDGNAIEFKLEVKLTPRKA